MDIQFVFDDASVKNLPIEDLVYKYLYNLKVQGSNSTNSDGLLNSILISLQSKKNTLQIVYKTISLIIEQQTDVAIAKNIENKTTTLIQHIVMKSPKIISKTNVETLTLMLQFSIKRVTNGSSGNQHITIIFSLFYSLQKTLKNQEQQLNKVKSNIISMFKNPKFHPVSYTQLIRNKLYDLLLQAFPTKPDSSYIIIILNSTNSEKDPRNISKVFELYLVILKKTPMDILLPFKQTLYENLEAYYPIDFIGDEDQEKQMRQKNVNLEKISQLLNQCLIQQLFRAEIDQLLITKFSAPPCRKFIGTLQKFMKINQNKEVWDREIKKWMVIAVRLVQDQYLQDQISGTQYIARSLLTILQYCIKFDKNCYSVKFHKIVQTLCFRCFHQLYNVKNWKHSSTILNIYKNLLGFNTTKNNNLQLFLNAHVMKYLIKLFIKHSSTLAKASTEQQKDHLVVCLGTLLICQYKACHMIDIQQAGLLLIGLKQIFTQFSSEPNICLIILKIIMKIWQSSSKNNPFQNLILKTHESVFRKMIQVNIQTSSQQMIQSFMDYLIEISPDIRTIELIISLPNDQCKMYAIVQALSSVNIDKNNQIKLFIQLLKVLQQINWAIETKVILLVKRALSNWKLQKIINFCNYTAKQQCTEHKQYLEILTQCFFRAYQKINNMLEDEGEYSNNNSLQFLKFLKESQQSLSLWQLYFLRRIWRLQINFDDVRSNIASYLTSKKEISCFREILIAYFNNSIILRKINAELIDNTNTQCKYPYLLNTKTIKIQYFNHENINLYEPTYLHFLWKNNLIDDLNILGYLPEIILKDNSRSILEKVLTAGQTVVLKKIVPYINYQLLISKVLPYCIKYYEIKGKKQIEVLDIVSMHAILNFLVEKIVNKDQNYIPIRDHLQKNGQQIRQVLEKALQHRKRLVRQSARMLSNKLDSLSIK